MPAPIPATSPCAPPTHPSPPEFVKYLGRSGQCKVEETPKGWFIALIHRDEAEVRVPPCPVPPSVPLLLLRVWVGSQESDTRCPGRWAEKTVVGTYMIHCRRSRQLQAPCSLRIPSKPCSVPPPAGG